MCPWGKGRRSRKSRFRDRGLIYQTEPSPAPALASTNPHIWVHEAESRRTASGMESKCTHHTPTRPLRGHEQGKSKSRTFLHLYCCTEGIIYSSIIYGSTAAGSILPRTAVVLYRCAERSMIMIRTDLLEPRPAIGCVREKATKNGLAILTMYRRHPQAHLSGVDGPKGTDAQAVVLAGTEPVLDLLQLFLRIVDRLEGLGLCDVRRVALGESNSPRCSSPLDSCVHNHLLCQCVLSLSLSLSLLYTLSSCCLYSSTASVCPLWRCGAVARSARGGLTCAPVLCRTFAVPRPPYRYTTIHHARCPDKSVRSSSLDLLVVGSRQFAESNSQHSARLHTVPG